MNVSKKPNINLFNRDCMEEKQDVTQLSIGT